MCCECNDDTVDFFITLFFIFFLIDLFRKTFCPSPAGFLTFKSVENFFILYCLWCLALTLFVFLAFLLQFPLLSFQEILDNYFRITTVTFQKHPLRTFRVAPLQQKEPFLSCFLFLINYCCTQYKNFLRFPPPINIIYSFLSMKNFCSIRKKMRTEKSFSLCYHLFCLSSFFSEL